MKINITPISVYSNSGVQIATQFDLYNITYIPDNGAMANTRLLSAEEINADGIDTGSKELSSSYIKVSQAICDTWTDDANFIKAIAQSINLTPV